MTRTIAVLVCLATSCLGLGAFAQESGQAGYGGVTLVGGAPPSPKTPPAGYQYVTWPGFRATEQGSEVFLQLTGPVTYKEQVKGARILVTLNKAMVYLKNNLRPVITHNFPNTPVSQFRLRPLKGDQMQLEISLKHKTAHQIAMKTVGVYHYLVIAFAEKQAQ